MNWYCDKCQTDFTRAVKILGREAFDFHMLLHTKKDLRAECGRLRKGLEDLRDGGYGCKREAQAILDDELESKIDTETPDTGRSIRG